MKRFIAMLFSTIVLILVSGCATNLTVTYHSDPPGAVLYQGQQKFGYTPQTLVYEVSDEDKKRGSKILAGTTVRWASGATAEVKALKADLNKYGLSQQFNFHRPDGVPGRDADVRLSLELERLALMNRQAQAQEDQAFWQMYNAINQQYQRQQPTYTNCTSTLIGNTVNTSCY